MERSAPFDVGLDVEDQSLHGGLVIAVADDLERLHQRNARGEHGGELAAENRDIAGIDLAACPPLTLLADAGRRQGQCRRRSEEHTSELQSQSNLVCRLLLEKKKRQPTH